MNAKFGIDMKTGKGNWPSGMQSHAAGPTADGDFIVVEVWDSKSAQEEFMITRLVPALGEVGIAAPTRIIWADLLACHTPA